MSKLVIANFKMNGSKEFIESWAKDFLEEKKSNNRVVVALPSPYLSNFKESNLNLAGQNVSNQYLMETNDNIKQKFDQLTQESIQPILCIGEPLEIKETSKTMDYLLDQLKLLSSHQENIIIAYEPIWAIGTGLTPDVEDIQLAVDCIRGKFNKSIKVLYGGSVNSSNAANISAKTDIDGLLVGGASLNPKEFAKIAQLC